jgi:SPP1 gp7 family putative phage head morphogenesis protein
MIKYFQEQELEVLRALRKNKSITKDVSDALNVPKSKNELEALIEVALPRITEIVKINGTAAFAELGIEGSFDVTNPEVIKFIKKRAGLLIKSIGDTTLEKLKKTLAAGVDIGESIPNLADRISEVFTEAKGYRSELIARTETITASNEGSLEAYKQSGVVEKKQWLATMDDRVRDEHAAMNNEKVKLNEPFSNGEMAPSSPNCRCTILPVIKE